MKTERVKVAPSVLSADFGNLERAIARCEEGGADWLHLDIMDGHFVPNLTFGPMVAASIRRRTKLPLDAHLMVADPDRWLEPFRDAGIDRLTVHVETARHLDRTVARIRELGMKPGVTLNPSTPAVALEEIIPKVDLVLVMTVNPGFGGQKFIRTMLPKMERIAGMIGRAGTRAELEVDGGVDEGNAGELAACGATVLVAGHSLFSRKNLPAAIRALKRAARPGAPSPRRGRSPARRD